LCSSSISSVSLMTVTVPAFVTEQACRCSPRHDRLRRAQDRL
jgi:hypothetical protein